VQQALRAHHDHLGAREGEADMPSVQGDDGDSTVLWIHGADGEEELTP
jgi:hypothetical protein